MNKPADMPPTARPPVAPATARPEGALNDDRPFAEIRRNLHDLLRIISLHRWAFFVPFCLVTSAAFLLSLRYPRTYSAYTSFERQNDPLIMELPGAPRTDSLKVYTNALERELTSASGLMEIVEGMDLIDPAFRNPDGTWSPAGLQRRAALASALAPTITITTGSPTQHLDIIQLRYNGPDPTIGPRLLDELKKTYIRKSLHWTHDFLERQRAYLQREADAASEELKGARREETAWRLANPHVNIEDPGALAAQIEQLELSRRELILQRREHESQLAAYQQLQADATAPPEAPPSVGPMPLPPARSTALEDAETSRLKKELADLDSRIEDLRVTRGMTDLHPEIQKLRETRDATLRMLDRQQESLVEVAMTPSGPGARETASAASRNPALDRFVVEIAAERSKLANLAISIQTVEDKIASLKQARSELFQRQEEFADVQERVVLASRRHQQVLNSIAAVEPAIQAVEAGHFLQFSPGEPARGSVIPVNPKSTTILLLAVLAGIAAGTVFTVLAEVFDNVYRSSTEVARSLGLPILDSIDEIITSADRRKRILTQSVLSPIVVTCFLVITLYTGTMAYLSIQNPGSFKRLKRIPEAAMRLLSDAGDAQRHEPTQAAEASDEALPPPVDKALSARDLPA
ncbi:MAG: hypothetical protein J5J06_02115 [Phycisphaerae bacterium]|nr:hypothetical protein [Phycisphaerae bacterium]